MGNRIYSLEVYGFFCFVAVCSFLIEQKKKKMLSSSRGEDIFEDL